MHNTPRSNFFAWAADLLYSKLERDPYVLESEPDGLFYTGSLSDLLARLSQHRIGHVRSTMHQRPLALIYHDACLKLDDARRRERLLKTGKGKRYLRTRRAGLLANLGDNELERYWK